MAPAPATEPALATTKRKFDTLLDRLTASASASSLASTLHQSNASMTSVADPTTPEPVSKRSRHSDVSIDRPRIVSGGERIKALKEQLTTPRKASDRRVGAGMRAVGSNTPTKLSTPGKPANYQPFNKEQFLERLRTFADVKKWTNKPDAIGEVEWAKRGWVCDTWNTVACKGGCEQRVVVSLWPKRNDASGKEIEMSEDFAEDVDEKLVGKFQELIVAGHHEDCLWRKRGCAEDIYHIPIPSRAKSSAELLNRYHSLRAIANDLPLLENLIYPHPPIDDILRRIPSTFFNPQGSDTTEQPPTSSTDKAAFALALFGWTGVSESKITLAVCNHCFQRLGLWLYEAKRLSEMSTKLDVSIQSLYLNPLEAHREHCPWKNPTAQHNPSDGLIANMAAWQTLEFMLLGKRKERPEQQHQRTHTRNIESVDLGSEMTYPRGSMDSDNPSLEKEREDDDSLHEKWRRFKARLRRTTSKKSLKSSMSMRSGKSGKSGKTVKSAKSTKSAPLPEKDKENAGTG